MGNKSSLMLQDEEIKQISEDTGFSPTQIEKLYSRFAHLDRGNCGTLSKDDLMSIPELAINPLCDRLIQMFFSDCDPRDTNERINFKQFMRVLATFRSTPNHNKNNTSIISTSKHRGNDGNHNETVTQSTPQLYGSGVDIVPSLTVDNVNTGHNRKQNQALDYATKVKSFNDKLDSGCNINIQGLNDTLRDKLLFIFRIYDADEDGRISFHDLKSILKMMVGNYIDDPQLDKIANRALVEVDEDNDGFIEFSEFCKVFIAKDLDDKLRVKFFT